MFWEKGYTPSKNIEALLNKENVTVEELLDEDDILQECKSQKNIVNYFTRPDVTKRLVELITTEPSEDLPLAQRFRHANMACEILTLGLPSLNAKLLSDDDILHTLYSYLENKPPLNPLLSSFFSKTFNMLFTRGCYQDWFLYQKRCLELIEYFKSRGNFLELIFTHFSTPVIPNLLIQMMNDVDGGGAVKNLYEWLTEEKLVERLIMILGDAKESDKHTNVSDFIVELIVQGRYMRQRENETDSFEPAFAGSNPILQVIESEATISSLLNVILEPSANEHAIISGISVVLTLVNSETFEGTPKPDSERVITEKEKEICENIISTVIRVVGPRLKEFIGILRNPPVKPDMLINGAKMLPPFGRTRLEICRLFTVLLQTGNEDITNAICETEYFNTILALFKDYCWNNFLHNQVEKCMQIIFPSNSKDSSSNNNNNISTRSTKDGSFQNDDDQQVSDEENKGIANTGDGENNDGGDDSTKANKSPSALQTFAIVNNKIISKLIDCWMHNNEMQNAENGRRLGYMGHLMKIFKHITACISESDHIGALIESSLSETELEQWQSIIKPNDGEFTVALAVQNRMLANCNAQKSVDYSQHLPKEFFIEEFSSDILNDFTATLNNMFVNMDEGMLANSVNEIFETEDVYFDAFIDHALNSSETKNHLGMQTFSHWGSGSAAGGAGESGVDPFNDLSLIGQPETSGGNKSNAPPVSDWADFSADNFADFDAHFSAFSSDLGDSTSEKREKNQEQLAFPDADTDAPAVNLSFSSSSSSSTKSDDVKSEFDNNANVEKTAKSADPFDDDDEHDRWMMDDDDAKISVLREAEGDDAWARMSEDETAKTANLLSKSVFMQNKNIEDIMNQFKNISVNMLPTTCNEDDNDEQLNISSDDNITQKNNPPPSSSSSATTTTTTNESLCQEKETASNTIFINQDTKSNSSPAATAAEEITPAL